MNKLLENDKLNDNMFNYKTAVLQLIDAYAPLCLIQATSGNYGTTLTYVNYLNLNKRNVYYFMQIETLKLGKLVGTLRNQQKQKYLSVPIGEIGIFSDKISTKVIFQDKWDVARK